MRLPVRTNTDAEARINNTEYSVFVSLFLLLPPPSRPRHKCLCSHRSPRTPTPTPTSSQKPTARQQRTNAGARQQFGVCKHFPRVCGVILVCVCVFAILRCLRLTTLSAPTCCNPPRTPPPPPSHAPAPSSPPPATVLVNGSTPASHRAILGESRQRSDQSEDSPETPESLHDSVNGRNKQQTGGGDEGVLLKGALLNNSFSLETQGPSTHQHLTLAGLQKYRPSQILLDVFFLPVVLLSLDAARVVLYRGAVLPRMH